MSDGKVHSKMPGTWITLCKKNTRSQGLKMSYILDQVTCETCKQILSTVKTSKKD